MGASRFPGKPMAAICGIPMVEHCYKRTKLCDFIDEVYVATCDRIIYDHILSIDGKVVMTSDLHVRATERVAEAILNIEKLPGQQEYDLVIMVQGDEPLVHPEMLKEVVQPLLDGSRSISNLMAEIHSEEAIHDSNVVKVVFSQNNSALYMSREPIPSKRNYKNGFKTYRQLGLIGFAKKELLNFVKLTPTPLEIIESVDMNRFLENNISIHMVETNYTSDAVDNLEDLERVSLQMQTDLIFQKYLNM